ncbi:MAG: alanine--tRNA ligase [Deltaproteobacteria bacterium]
MKLDEIRSLFLNYFKDKGHTIVPSSSLVPRNDPTLLFTNAGMVQFKDYFLGLKEPDYKTAASSQICIRAGGKHNDLEQVGQTSRHHTFFEMLGNFSFGDYFKEKAIHLAWDFLTNELKISKDRLYVSVFDKDKDAYQIWNKKIKIESCRIYKFDEKDNFWAMGDTGPCGPCSEIYYDQGLKVGCRKKTCDVGCLCDRYIEIWNLVFMEFERNEKGELSPLPKPSIDTGMGLERVAAILQGVQSNYEIDLFRALIGAIAKLTDRTYGKNKEDDISMRVIADHLRASAFLISEGVLPSNEGRGYVLRRIIRRAIRHGKKLSMTKPFIYHLVSTLVELMGEAYPQLGKQKPFTEKVIFSEEERFLDTLTKGLKLLDEEIYQLEKERKRTISGETAYKLYDTFGFPLDLIRVISVEKKFQIDEEGFRKQMEEQRARARGAWKGFGERKEDPLYKKLQAVLKSVFRGYETTEIQGKLKSIIQDGNQIQSASPSASPSTSNDQPQLKLIFDQTPFYGEQGGQIGDTGVARNDHSEIQIIDTQRPSPNLIVHVGVVKKGTINLNETFKLIVDSKRRHDIMLNHTATHMLHYALQAQLGDHVRQAGSLVAPDRLRFDFTHFSPMTSFEIKRLEDFMNERISANDPVSASVMSYKEAIDLGAMALFGEKYEERVRVLQVGDYSVELCGGTHLHGTGEIRLFKIISETALASGVRRIEALTGDAAVKYLEKRDQILRDIEDELKTTEKDVGKRVQQLVSYAKELEKRKGQLEEKGIAGHVKELLEGVRETGGVKILATVLNVSEVRVLRTYCDHLRDQMKSGIVVLGAIIENRAVLIAAVTKDLTGRYSADQIIRKLSVIVGGKGGGKPDLAQGGGPQTNKLSEAISAAYKL